MRPIHVLVLVALLSPAMAQAPCGQWENMPDFPGSTLEPDLKELVTDSTGSELYAGVFDTDFSLNGVRILHWTGSSWTTIGGWVGRGMSDLEVIDLGLGAEIYVALYDEPGLPSVFRFDGVAFQPLPNLSGGIRALAGFDDGTGSALFGTTSSGLFRLQGNTWVPASASPGPYVGSLVVHDDGSGAALYGTQSGGVVRWDGTSWNAVGSFTGPSHEVTKLLSARDAHGLALYAQGRFDFADGTPANGIARWDGTSWTGIGSTLPGVMKTNQLGGMTVFDEGTGQGPMLVVNVALDTPTPGFDETPFCLRWDGANWTSLPGLPAGTLLGIGPILGLDLPGTVGRDLIIGRRATSGIENLSRLGSCDLVGTLLCFGDGSTTACPCGNASAIGERAGCLNSASTAGALRARGTASLTSDSLRLDGSGMTPSYALYFQGASQHAATVFGNGLTCTGGPFVRIGVKHNVAGASSHPGVGDSPISVKGNVAVPGVRYYQVRYRDLLTTCTPAGFNYTNSVQVLWSP